MCEARNFVLIDDKGFRRHISHNIDTSHGLHVSIIYIYIHNRMYQPGDLR